MPSLIDQSGNVDYFGRLSWGNFLDWLVTLCLGAIIGVTTVLLGGVRPDTHLVILPLFMLLLALHGIWLAVDDETPKRISHVPLLFLPFLVWMVCNTLWISPAAWRGWQEVIYTLEVFVFVWVLSNNVRTRAHLWVLILLALAPAGYAVFIGYYQFFQNPGQIADAATEYAIRLSPEFLGQATGSFADPNSFAVFLLVLLPALLIAGLVPRLPMVLRLCCFYVAAMFLGAIVFTQVFWPFFMVLPLLVLIPWLCFERISRRLKFFLVGAGLFLVVMVPLAIFYPRFQKSFQAAASEEGEGVRLVLWKEAAQIAREHPLTGAGAGSFPMRFEQSGRVALPDLPSTPHNDYLLILSQYGLIGLVLFGVPVLYVLLRAYRSWRKESFTARFRNRKGVIMPPGKFFLSLGLAGTLIFGICLSFNFVFYVPALGLYGAVFFVVLIKSTFTRSICLPAGSLMRMVYCLFGIGLGYGLYAFAAPRLEARGIELQARQQLEYIVAERIHVSGNPRLLDEVIEQYEAATVADPNNAEAWIGLSAARCQLFFRHPSEFVALGESAAEAAQRAVELSGGYWLAWAQLGVAQSLAGELDLAEASLERALELAPNSSNAHYYKAAYLSAFPERREAATAAVERALEINPNNLAARRLQRKIRIL